MKMASVHRHRRIRACAQHGWLLEIRPGLGLLAGAAMGTAVAQESEGLTDVLRTCCAAPRAAIRARPGAACRSGGGNPAVLRAAGEEDGAGGGQRLRLARQGAGRPLRATPSSSSSSAARSGRARSLARLRRHRRSERPDRHQQPRHRRRRRGEGGALRRPRVRQQGPAEGRVARSRRAEDRGATSRFPSSRSAIPTRWRSATWCWRSATRSASARRSPTASSRRSPAPISA